uniref:Uncharacterized protein n=1 Tax=Musa acuminata subsp. malaccensis TaxID=214687 RepID=A0A804KMB4_MUSAM
MDWIYAGNIELLNLLFSKGVNVESQSDAGTPLIWAAGHGQEESVQFLLEHHANANAETDDNITPLLSAVAAGSLPCLELLLQAGANPNASAGGATPLHVAADNGSREIVSCLIRAGGDPNLCDDVNSCKSFCLCLKLTCCLSISYYWIVNVPDCPC